MQPRDRGHLADILHAAKCIQKHTTGLSLQQFANDDRTRTSTLYHLMVIGEASKRVSPAARQELTAIPWAEMAKARDFLIHHYEETDDGTVWLMVTEDIPVLIDILSPLLLGNDQ
jgi:uncharacterized protein with HEPN domain